MVNIVGPWLHRAEECEAVLRSLPRWFGIESSLLAYARSSAELPGFASLDHNTVSGFISLKQHFPESWEVYCLAVRDDRRGQGVGTTLLKHAETWLLAQGAKVLQVKTLAETHPSPEYAETRAFYTARGFRRLEVFPALWSTSNPALQLVKVLQAG